MNRREAPMYPTIERSVQRSFIRAFTWVVGGWSMVSAILWWTVDRRDTGMFADTLVIAAASGVIALASQIPGILIRPLGFKREWRGQSSELWSPVIAAVATGMMIRSIGTVALFLTYRYHLASSTEVVAGMTLGWYVFLTSIEVFVLAKSLPKSVESSAGTVAIDIETSMSVKV